MEAGIGEMVSLDQILSMSHFVNAYGKDAFQIAVFHGAWAEVAYAYIHPHEMMRETKNFEIIQEAFINAYV